MLDNRTVLLVDENKEVIDKLILRLNEELESINIITAHNFKDATKYILDKNLVIHVAVIDVAIANSVIRFTTKAEIPTIIVTDAMNDATKDIIFKYHILDYVIKENKKYFHQVAYSINRILKNYSTNILVVDDSKLQLKAAVDMLKKNKLNITTANDGVEAYEIMQKNKDFFSLVLTDYNMPNMDGLELTLKIREDYDKDELGIIVLSANSSPEIPSEFIKMGANDFINKPYSQIEVSTRVNSNLDILELFQQTRDMANKDFLTGSYNRRYFYDSGQAIFSKARRDKRDLCVAMFDIDKFKNINDTYGHDVGDVAIKEIAKILNANLRESDLLARFGGEEFCVLLENISIDDSERLFEKIRLAFEVNVLETFTHTIQYTVSIGVCYGMEDDLDAMIKKADEGLYFCKNNGRNQVAINR